MVIITLKEDLINKILKKLFIILLSSVSVMPAFAEVKAHLNQTSFYEGDPITLKIDSTQNNDAEPDFSVLHKNFFVGQVRTSKQSFNLNGKVSLKNSWTIELQPRRKGFLQIPAITIGKEKTAIIDIKVTDLPPEIVAETKKHVFLETIIGTEGNKTFVQQQIPYTLKLFYDSTIQRAPIEIPVIKNAILEKLGRDKRYSVVRAGKRFTVVEKNFVISPEKSGSLHIPAATVKGRIGLSGADAKRFRMDETDMANNMLEDFMNDPFFRDSFSGGFFSRRSQGPSKPFAIKGDAIDVDVLPVPKAFTGKLWLPAEDLVIKDSWAKNPPVLKEGEPITRILTLQAKGLAGSQIPDISIPKPKNMKVYPNKAKFVTETDGNTVYGVQNINITYIPDGSGKVVIPKIKVDWWDVKNKMQKTFVLPAWNLNIAPDLTKPAKENIVAKDAVTQKPSSITEKKSVMADKDLEPASFWTWKLLIMIPLLLLFAILFYRLKKYWIKKQDNHQDKPSRNKIANLRSSLLQACENNDKQEASKNLLKFAQVYWHDDSLQNLGMVAARLQKKSDAKLIKDLEKNLYRQNMKGWSGEALAKLINDGLPQKKKAVKRASDSLVALYPALNK